MDYTALLLAFGAIIGASFGAYVTWKLGRGAALEDRLRIHELDSIADTRDRLLDVVRLGDALAQLHTRNVTAVGDLLAALRYSRARNVLLADDRLIDELTKTLPALLRTFPHATYELRSDMGRLGNLIREAMFDQETAVIRTGKPIRATPEQERRIDTMLDEVAELQERFRGWSGFRMRLVTFRRLTFGF